ncbi:MAG TPA: ATP-binding protein [Gemmatimonadales bacterium]|nr:ATP-binding protein [Gemmatimonadales bacterium]
MRSTPRRSLQQGFFLIALTGALLTVTAVIAVVAVSNRMRATLMAESRAIREEQRIADVVIGGVMRQMVTVSAHVDRADTAFRASFDAAGRSVVEGMQTYLFRDLSTEQRLQIERVKEAHGRMEVSALRTARVLDEADPTLAAEARQETMRHALVLLESMEGFLRLRELDLEALEQRQFATFVWFWIGGGGAALAVGGLLAVLVGRFLQGEVVRPLDELVAATAEVGEGNLAARVPTARVREFHQLAGSFNRMAEQLALAQQSLANRNADLEEALTQVRAAQAELVQSEKLGAVGRMTAGLAHELNNPLASVVGFSELLAAEARERPTLSAEAAATYIEPIVREATRARLLIRSLLQFARRAGTELGPVSLTEALDVAVGLQRHAYAQAGLRVVMEPPPPTLVVAEMQQLQSVFSNILGNALDAMRPSGHGAVRVVTALVDDDRVRLEFEDEGPGLRDPDRVFEPFYTTKEMGHGTGLGLALAKRFIEAFGGTIHAGNRPEGGARITVELRVTEARTTAPVAASTAGRLPSPTAVSGTRRVLVVEDEPHLQRLSALLLARIGVTPLIAGTVAEARKLMTEGGVDAIISDVKLPGESGLDFHRWVAQTHPELAGRFLFVTGDVDTPELSALAADHPHSLIMKPFQVADYLERVQEVLGDTSR